MLGSWVGQQHQGDLRPAILDTRSTPTHNANVGDAKGQDAGPGEAGVGWGGRGAGSS